jgi:hypothetical protein
MLIRIVAVALAAMLLFSCTKPSRYSEVGMVDLDDDTSYRITDREDGFRILVNYTEYQFWPRRGRSHQVCRDNLIHIAGFHAIDKKRKIEEIKESLIRVDSGRNALSGNTTCTATYKVKWAKAKPAS